MDDLDKEVILPRNALSFTDKVQMFLTILPAPVIIAWALLKSPFTAYGRSKSWKRIVIDRVTLRLVSGMSRKQIRAFFGPTSKAYSDFINSKKLPPVVEDVGEDARLFWIGPKNADRVLLYLHGGAFVFGTTASSPAFWSYMQDNLEKKGKPTSTAILDYSLVPDKMFPTQLKQTVLAIQHIVGSGVKPENIQLVGDSAGGVLIHEVISHILHPVEGVPELSLSSPFGGAYMMSPWVRLRDTPAKVLETDREGRGDFLTRRAGMYWANKVLDGVPESAYPYLDANTAPDDWLRGMDKCVKRILISAGSAEVLRDEIIKYAKTVEKLHKETTTVIQENGIHVDPFFDFLVQEKDLGKLTPTILNWLDEGFHA
ncbi:alpha/beta-hydrolase [Pholiota conissans]|uniref:Alpha/beta-hydrolase n=1 Tax=Pholiota conissans TaxID=109636 RepID=A0A9P5Z563_9AGAR|nr:alpha/beta-hydrolase [Pholiota conissans]